MKLKDLGLEEEILEIFEEVERRILEAEKLDDLQQQVNIVFSVGRYMGDEREKLYENHSKKFIDEQFAKGGEYIVSYLMPRMEKKKH